MYEWDANINPHFERNRFSQVIGLDWFKGDIPESQFGNPECPTMSSE